MIVPWGLVSAHDSSTHGYGSRVVATLAARGRETSLIGLRLVRLAEGASETVGDDGEMCAVVLVGTVEVTVDGTSLGIAVRSGDVFDSLADAVYVPPGQMLGFGRSRTPCSPLPLPRSAIKRQVGPE